MCKRPFRGCHGASKLDTLSVSTKKIYKSPYFLNHSCYRMICEECRINVLAQKSSHSNLIRSLSTGYTSQPVVLYPYKKALPPKAMGTDPYITTFFLVTPPLLLLQACTFPQRLLMSSAALLDYPLSYLSTPIYILKSNRKGKTAESKCYSDKRIGVAKIQ